MKEAKIIIKNSIWLIIGEAVSKIATFFLILIFARKVSIADFGKYNLAFSFVGIFSIITDLGLNIFLFREVSRDREHLSKYVSNILVMRIILSSIFFVVVYAFARFFNYSLDVMKLIYLFVAWSCVTSLTYVFRTSFKAMEIMRWDAVVNMVDNILRLIFTVLFLSVGLGIYGVGLAYSLGTTLAFCLVIFIFINFFAKLNFNLDFSLWRFALKEMKFLSLTAFLIPIFGKFDSIILAHFSGDEAVGFYGASLKLVWMLIMGPGFITQSVFPLLSQSAFKDEDKFRNSISYLLKTNFILGLFVSLAIFLFATPIIYFIYGAKYLASASVLRILIWCFPLQGLNGVFIYGLNALNKQKVNTIFIGSSILLNILLDIILALKFSYIGVAFATLISVITLLLVFMYYYVKNYHINLKELNFSKKDIYMIKRYFQERRGLDQGSLY